MDFIVSTFNYGKKRFYDLTPHEIVPILAEEGVYIVSESSFYRVLRKAGLMKHRKTSKKPSRSVISELKATAPNQLLSWDISYLKTKVKGQYYYLYMIVDIWSRFISGWEIHLEESGELAKGLFTRICEEQKIDDAILHSDNGGSMRSSVLASTLEVLGVKKSFSRPSVSNDNAYSESLFKTLKYTAGYPKSFNTIDGAREWVRKFVKWYNTEHRHSGIGYVTPHQRHTGKDIEIFAERNKVYKTAKQKNQNVGQSMQKTGVMNKMFI